MLDSFRWNDKNTHYLAVVRIQVGGIELEQEVAVSSTLHEAKSFAGSKELMLIRLFSIIIKLFFELLNVGRCLSIQVPLVQPYSS